jgi:NDP-sugar pyrophosphorylase family protein
LRQWHEARGGLATIALHEREEVSQSGIVALDANDRIVRLLEKPRPEQVFSHWVSAGIFILEPAVLEAIPNGGASDFGYQVLPALLAGGAALHGYRLSEEEGLWALDRPEDLDRTRAHPRWAVGQ